MELVISPDYLLCLQGVIFPLIHDTRIIGLCTTMFLFRVISSILWRKDVPSFYAKFIWQITFQVILE